MSEEFTQKVDEVNQLETDIHNIKLNIYDIIEQLSDLQYDLDLINQLNESIMTFINLNKSLYNNTEKLYDMFYS